MGGIWGCFFDFPVSVCYICDYYYYYYLNVYALFFI